MGDSVVEWQRVRASTLTSGVDARGGSATEDLGQEAALVGGCLFSVAVLPVAPLAGGDHGFDVRNVLATASPGGLVTDFAGYGTAHIFSLMVWWSGPRDPDRVCR